MKIVGSVCFTGHRKVTITEEPKKRLYGEIEKLIKNGVVDFFAGGAIGFNMLAESAVIELKSKYPQIKLHLVLPCPEEQQMLR